MGKSVLFFSPLVPDIGAEAKLKEKARLKTRAFFSWGKAEARKSAKEGKGKMRTNTRKFRLLTSLTLMALLLAFAMVTPVGAQPPQ